MVNIKSLVESYMDKPSVKEGVDPYVDSELNGIYDLVDMAKEYYENGSFSSMVSTLNNIAAKAQKLTRWADLQLGKSESTVSTWQKAYDRGHELGLNDGDVGVVKTDDVLKKMAQGLSMDDTSIEKYIQGYKDGLVDNRNASKPVEV